MPTPFSPEVAIIPVVQPLNLFITGKSVVRAVALALDGNQLYYLAAPIGSSALQPAAEPPAWFAESEVEKAFVPR